MPHYYQHHVFVCTNQRQDGSNCCANFNAQAMRDYMKQRCKDLGIVASGSTRINSAGCLNRCELGPVLVVYPQGTWYTYVDEKDIDEIIQSHLQNGQVVERLLVDPT